MNPLRQLRRRAGMTQAQLARAAATSQPTIAAYEADRKSPTLDTVHRLANAVGLEPSVDFHPRMTREERRSLALHRAIADKLVEDPAPVLAQARQVLRLMRRKHPHARQLLREWGVLLDRPINALVPAMLSPEPWARELRHVTPFAGILTAPERTAVYRAFAGDEADVR